MESRINPMADKGCDRNRDNLPHHGHCCQDQGIFPLLPLLCFRIKTSFLAIKLHGLNWSAIASGLINLLKLYLALNPHDNRDLLLITLLRSGLSDRLLTVALLCLFLLLPKHSLQSCPPCWSKSLKI